MLDRILSIMTVSFIENHATDACDASALRMLANNRSIVSCMRKSHYKSFHMVTSDLVLRTAIPTYHEYFKETR